MSPIDFPNAVHYHKGDFPPSADKIDLNVLLAPLTDAATYLSEYDTKMDAMLNSALLIAPLREQDAIASSRMEGTISTIDAIYEKGMDDKDKSDSADTREIRNDTLETILYKMALQEAESALEDGYPLNQSLIRGVHKRLLLVGRGAHKNPGNYKREQNYVGEGRSEIKFVPIAPIELAPAMEALFTFINAKDAFPLPLIRTAIAHVEFEALHPFEDGNGRVGRMLITLMLSHLGILRKPHFFVSGYFENYKGEYIARMRAVSAKGDWTGWIAFFLTAMAEQAKVNIKTLDSLSALYQEMRVKFRQILNSKYHDKALDYIFAHPILDNGHFSRNADVPMPSARKITQRLEREGVLEIYKPASGRQATLYKFERFLEIVRI